MPAKGVIESGIETLLEFVYPSCCLVCSEYIDQPGELICPTCRDRIDTFDYIFCGNCEQPLSDDLTCSTCAGQEALPILALGQYVDPLSEIVRFFKYRKFRKLGPVLAEKLLVSYKRLPDKIKIDVIVPIPLHSYRLKMRGYNQSLILADTIGERLNIPVIRDGLIKIRHNKYQKSLDPIQRERNVENVYEIGDAQIANKKIMLVDDVITTGATLREARRVLQKAGGRVILAAVIAGTGSWK